MHPALARSTSAHVDRAKRKAEQADPASVWESDRPRGQACQPVERRQEIAEAFWLAPALSRRWPSGSETVVGAP